jgi:hypothetical protein
MQRRAFEVTADWDDIQQSELDPPALERLADIRVPPWPSSAGSASTQFTTRHGA